MTLSLRELEQQSGARFAHAAESDTAPLDFGNPREEYLAARDSCAVVDLGPRTQFALTGADRHKFLHNFCTNDINRLAVGQSCEAFLTNVKGRILGHVCIFVEPDALWIETVDGQEDPLISHLDRYLIREDVEFHRHSVTHGELYLTGPSSAATIEAVAPGAGALAPSAHMRVEKNELVAAVRRVDWFGTVGFLISTQREALPAWWSAFVKAGAHAAGSSTYETLRIESGWPHYGIDLSEDNLAQECARTVRAISFTKGCYLGQEPIARIDAMGHVNRELRGLRWQGSEPTVHGARVLNPADQEPIGSVSSSALAYDPDGVVSLGMVRREFVSPGTKVLVETAAGPVEATVFWPEGLRGR